ncbi:hypothetical protein [Actinophytocola sp.]|uniref:hypothetical protein n=1 Tax=Actinophytocola sp. TaxID=1872138 RepID=UPI002D2334EA|nr:hypothetical protein [Actinophytocola sp.]HYQ69058.1 hypothetical protein [Actinophytocola sp.]
MTPLGVPAEIGIGIEGNRVVTIVPAPGDGMYYTAEQSARARAAYEAAEQIIAACEEPSA